MSTRGQNMYVCVCVCVIVCCVKIVMHWLGTRVGCVFFHIRLLLCRSIVVVVVVLSAHNFILSLSTGVFVRVNVNANAYMNVYVCWDVGGWIWICFSYLWDKKKWMTKDAILGAQGSPLQYEWWNQQPSQSHLFLHNEEEEEEKKDQQQKKERTEIKLFEMKWMFESNPFNWITVSLVKG